MSARRRTAGAAGARAGRAPRRARRRGRARSSSRPRGPASVSEARPPATGFGPRRRRGRSLERPRARRAAAPGPGGRASSRCRAARRSARTPRGRRASLAATVVPRRRGRGRGRPGRARGLGRAFRRPSGCAYACYSAPPLTRHEPYGWDGGARSHLGEQCAATSDSLRFESAGRKISFTYYGLESFSKRHRCSSFGAWAPCHFVRGEQCGSVAQGRPAF